MGKFNPKTGLCLKSQLSCDPFFFCLLKTRTISGVQCSHFENVPFNFGLSWILQMILPIAIIEMPVAKDFFFSSEKAFLNDVMIFYMLIIEWILDSLTVNTDVDLEGNGNNACESSLNLFVCAFTVGYYLHHWTKLPCSYLSSVPLLWNIICINELSSLNLTCGVCLHCGILLHLWSFCIRCAMGCPQISTLPP